MNNPNFIEARKMATELLIMQEELFFPIDVEKICLKNKKIIFSSYENYVEKVGTITEEDLKCNGKFEDAMVINLEDDFKLILYNDKINSKGRILWNKAHELGHIVLKHTQQGDKEEIEANTFASQLLLPQCLLKKLLSIGISITPQYLMSNFGLSKAATESCLKLVGPKLERNFDAEYDDVILFKAKEFIEKESKKHLRSNYYDIDMDEERNRWLYEL